MTALNSDNAIEPEDSYRAAMNEMTVLMGSEPGSPEEKRLLALTTMVKTLAASLPSEPR